MELQLGQIDLLMAMYPSEDEVLVDEEARALIGSLRAWCDGAGDDVETAPRGTPADLSFVLSLDVSAEPEASASSRFLPTSRRLQLDIALPLRYDGSERPPEPPAPRVRIRQPEWLSRAETARLAGEVPGADGDEATDMLGVIEAIKEAASRALPQLDDGTGQSNGNNAHPAPSGQGGAEPPVRVWFHFPSISTRAKRDDLVSYAPMYGLTGFLLAGKPGVLCVEGSPSRVDAYMRFIRTESWGDIPAHHKKVSERYRETIASTSPAGDVGDGRAFPDMREITDELAATRRGERGNRNDMKVLEAWLVERGLGDAFGKVFHTGSAERD